MRQSKYKPGQVFGQWTLRRYVKSKRRWEAECSCGSVHLVQSAHLAGGASTRCRACYGKARTTHGLSRSPTFRSWDHMLQRCLNPNNDRYHQYGGAGVTLDPRWAEFENFLADMGERPEGTSLDRKDPEGPYTKDNCRWATPVEQMNNRRGQVRYTHQGKSLTMAQWARELGMNLGTLQARLYRGWSFEDAITVGNVKGQKGYSKCG